MDSVPHNEIRRILDNNQIGDLKRFLRKRQRLNMINSYLIYLFHFIISCTIFISSFGAGTGDARLIWIGVGLNLLSSLIHVYEKLNDNQLKRLFNDVIAIKNGNYIDESAIINIDNMNNETRQHNQVLLSAVPSAPPINNLE